MRLVGCIIFLLVRRYDRYDGYNRYSLVKNSIRGKPVLQEKPTKEKRALIPLHLSNRCEINHADIVKSQSEQGCQF